MSCKSVCWQPYIFQMVTDGLVLAVLRVLAVLTVLAVIAGSGVFRRRVAGKYFGDSYSCPLETLCQKVLT